AFFLEEAMSPSSLKLYEAQFFGFTPQTAPFRTQLRSRARECSQKLQIFLQERFKRLSCRMDTVLVNNVLSVPPNMLLPDDQPHKKYFQRLVSGMDPHGVKYLVGEPLLYYFISKIN
uniref:Protein MIS12 homolog n=1 Tax=Salmo trutta TaxID=8032 RepID=A0A673ZKI8_SALTR